MRMCLAVFWIMFFGLYYDIFIVDQVSVVLPILKFFGRKTIFYCHFPDKALIN